MCTIINVKMLDEMQPLNGLPEYSFDAKRGQNYEEKPPNWKRRLKMIGTTTSTRSRKDRTYLYLAVAVCNLSALSLGISLSWSSPVISKLNGEVETDDIPIGRLITKDEESLIGSVLTLGAACGPYLAGFLADSIGRRNTLLLNAGIPFLVSFVTLAFSTDIRFYYVARFMGGFALGGVFCVLPNYVSEIAEDKNRGAMGAVMNVFITLGLLFSYVLGPYMSIMAFSLCCAIVPALFIVSFVFFPESPYYLVRKGRVEEANAALMRFRPKSAEGVAKELELIKTTVEEATRNQASFLDIFRTRGNLWAFMISMSLVAFQQLSGINVVLFYTQQIFEATGSSIPSALSSIIIGGAQIVPSAITSCVADTKGRKATLLFSAVGMVIAEAPLGLYFYLKDDGYDVRSIFWLPVVCLVVYIVMFRVGFGPLPWMIMAELFPTRVKAAASTATASFCYLLAFLITRYFRYVTDSIGMGGGFWVFTTFCILAAIFIWRFVPETKKKSFQEIQDILQRKQWKDKSKMAREENGC